MSCQNDVGSVLGDYDYQSHHVDPYEPDDATNGRHSPIDAYCDKLETEKEALLGHGTNSTPESKRQHMMAMQAQLAAIDCASLEKPAPSPGKEMEESVKAEKELQKPAKSEKEAARTKRARSGQQGRQR